MENDRKRDVAPLAVRMRPRTLDEVVGQTEAVGEGSWLRAAIENDTLSSVILFGPAGTGKTSLAHVIAESTRATFVEVSAIGGTVSDLRREIDAAEKRLVMGGLRTILFVDEIHRFNRSQQDALLHAVEDRLVVLVGATTENPFFEVNSALISRSRIVELHSLSDDEIAEEVDAPMFGTILHAAVQKLYARIVGEAHPGETLRAMIRTGEIAAAVEAAINENYLQDPAATTDDYTGNLLLVKDIVTRYLRGGVMPYDAAHDGFTVTGLEREVAYGFDFTAAGRPLCMKFAGIADRIDALDDGTLRVVDYKTGAPHLEFAGVESLFRGEGKQRLSNILQTLLYAMMLYRTRGVDAEPALYYVRAMNRPDYLPTLDDRETGVRGGRYTLYAERFEELVRQTLAELYDPSVPFRQCEDADTCNFCDFNVICKR